MYINVNSSVVDAHVKSIVTWRLSLTTTFFNHHVLMMPQGQVVVLVVEHGQRAESCWDTGWTGHSLGVLLTQEALEKQTIHMNNWTTLEKNPAFQLKRGDEAVPACTRNWWAGRIRPVGSDTLPRSETH